MKKYVTVTDNFPIRIYVNQIENRNLELSTTEMIKLPGRTKSKITKDENDESVARL